MEKVNGVEFLERMSEDKVIDLNNPSCNNCNECCSILTMILPQEYKELKKFLTKDKRGKEIYKRAVQRRNNINRGNTISMMCPFSNGSKKCDIYYERPSICKSFHCKKELCKDYDKSMYASVEHNTLYDLFL